jgi:sugar lactone lactonase YvrE
MKVKYEKPFVCNSSYKSILGQRPIWDWRHDKLLWIDIHENKIIETDQNVQEENYYLIPEGVTNILLQDNENYLMSSFDSLFSLHSSISKKQLLTKINLKKNNDRINDADIDINGQVWISTMDTQQQSDTGMIIGYNSNFDPIFQDGSYIISNGPIFDYERNIGYVTDSIKRIIYSFSINDVSSNGFQKKIFLSLNNVDGNPDGMAVDKSGNLWVAMWGSGKVCCFDKNSNLKLILQLPVSKVTSCTFGGTNLNELYITTASVGLNDIEAERQPHAGKLFKFITQEQGYASNCYRSENTVNLYH